MAFMGERSSVYTSCPDAYAGAKAPIAVLCRHGKQQSVVLTGCNVIQGLPNMTRADIQKLTCQSLSLQTPCPNAAHILSIVSAEYKKSYGPR